MPKPWKLRPPLEIPKLQMIKMVKQWLPDWKVDNEQKCVVTWRCTNVLGNTAGWWYQILISGAVRLLKKCLNVNVHCPEGHSCGDFYSRRLWGNWFGVGHRDYICILNSTSVHGQGCSCQLEKGIRWYKNWSLHDSHTLAQFAYDHGIKRIHIHKPKIIFNTVFLRLVTLIRLSRFM